MNKEWHESQRGYFAGALREEMKNDDKIYVLTGDLGFGQFDKIQEEFPDRFINVGAAEQALMGIAVGLALEGKKPFVYTITSFFLRAAETINLYLSHEQIPVRLVGGGRDDDYHHDGFSHNGTQAQKFLHDMDLTEYYPKEKEDVPEMVKSMVTSDTPSFISLKR